MGCPANDLVRLFTTSLSGKDRQQHWEELVEQFYGYLKEEAVGLEMPYTIDQNAHMGCPANDLVLLFTTSLSGKDRQQHWEELVEQFYGYLKEEAVGLEMPYTIDQVTV
ncbi:hypothetical protein ANCDUO_03485 [Ancylostoma duodenale]|uniref:Uncharacterized protein n=1 Tax=Ancylostoma duodenale TaxID=51022 RepID=A0A0C2GXC8_9BILA|nr:hypothetical protein ANCDUO_03485 [Ancylostoma duodenale]